MTHAEREAQIFGRYILGAGPSQAAVDLYVSAISKLAGSLGDADPAVRFAIEHPWSLPLLDAALAIRDRNAALRRRLLVMFAILEVQPAYSDRFLPCPHRSRDLLRIAIGVLRAGLSGVFGLALLRLVRRA